MNKRQSWNVVTLFVIMIFGFTVATLLKPASDFSESENRTLAQMPQISADRVFSGKFAEDYEDYLNDQFILRDNWIGLKTTTERLMQKQDIKDVYFAADDYLIEKHTDTFETDQAAANMNTLSAFFQKLSEQYDSSHLTAMVVPNAVDILRDKLPAFAAPYDEERYLKQIAAALPEGTYLDTSAVLSEHKAEDIYYRTDHHWKTLGAFYVYQQWVKQTGLTEVTAEDYEVKTLTTDFQGTVASKIGCTTISDTIEQYVPKDSVSYKLTYNQSDDTRISLYDDASLSGKDKYAVFFGGNYGLIEAATTAGTGRRLLVIKDSYAHCFAPFALQQFDQVDMVDLRYFNQSLSEYMAQKEYTDILFLYNASGFAEDTSLARLLT